MRVRASISPLDDRQQAELHHAHPGTAAEVPDASTDTAQRGAGSGLLCVQIARSSAESVLLRLRHVAPQGIPQIPAIAGVNDSLAHATELVAARPDASAAELFHLSVIAYIQATGADPAFAAPAPATVDAFVSHLRANGVHATRRRQADTDD